MLGNSVDAGAALVAVDGAALLVVGVVLVGAVLLGVVLIEVLPLGVVELGPALPATLLVQATSTASGAIAAIRTIVLVVLVTLCEPSLDSLFRSR